MVVVSVLSLTTTEGVKGLRVLRALRPLRAVARFPSLQLVVYALVRALPQILNVLVLCTLLFLLFGIAFVNYFKGGLHHCTGPVFDSLTPEQVGGAVHCSLVCCQAGSACMAFCCTVGGFC